MPKRFILSVCLLLCSAQPSAGQEVEFSLSDTTRWSNTTYGGRMVVLSVQGVVIDTVDLYPGVHPVPGGLIFVPMRDDVPPHSECSESGVCHDAGTWKYWTHGGTAELADILPGMHPRYSHPLPVDGLLFYLGIDCADGGGCDLSARSFDLASRTGGASDLGHVLLESEPDVAFRRPTLEGECIVFRVSVWEYRVTKGLQPCS